MNAEQSWKEYKLRMYPNTPETHLKSEKIAFLSGAVAGIVQSQKFIDKALEKEEFQKAFESTMNLLSETALNQSIKFNENN